MSGSLSIQLRTGCDADEVLMTLSSTAAPGGDHYAQINWYFYPVAHILTIELEATPGVWVAAPSAYLFTEIGEQYTLRARGPSAAEAALQGLTFPYKVYGIYAPDWASVYGEIIAEPVNIDCCPSIPFRYRGWYSNVWYNFAPPLFGANLQYIVNVGTMIGVEKSSNAPDIYGGYTAGPSFCLDDTANARGPTVINKTISYDNAFTNPTRAAFYAAAIPSTPFSVNAAGVSISTSSYTGTSISGTISKAANSYNVTATYTMTFGLLGGRLCLSDPNTTVNGGETTVNIPVPSIGALCGSITITAANRISISDGVYPYTSCSCSTIVAFGFRN